MGMLAQYILKESRRARSSTVSLSWHLNDHWRAIAHYVHRDFGGADFSYIAASREDALMFRVQVGY
jgi:hypothetical protein